MTARTKQQPRQRLLYALILCVAVAGLGITVWHFTSGRPIASRPHIVNLLAAPAAARPLIQQIAQRNDDTCYPQIIGKQVGPNVVGTKYNFQKYDYVSVDSVQDNAQEVVLGIDCISSAADIVELTPSGWKEDGQRQI